MSNLDLLIAYFSSTPFPVVIYRSPPASSSTSKPTFELDQTPTYLNKTAEGYLGRSSFARSVASISQEVLKDGLNRSRETFWASRKGKERASGASDDRIEAMRGGAPDEKDTVPTISDEITLLHRVELPRTPSSMVVDDERSLGKDGPPADSPPLFPSAPAYDKDNPIINPQIPGKGSLQLCRWHLSILDDPSDVRGTTSILILTGKWYPTSTTEIDRSRSQARKEVEDVSMENPRPGPSPLPGARNDVSDVSMKLDVDEPVMAESIPSELRKRAADLKIKFPQPLPSGMKPTGEVESRRPSSYIDPKDLPAQTEDAQTHSCFPCVTEDDKRANGESSHSFYTTGDPPMGKEPLQLNPLILARLAENAPIGMVIATTSARLIWVNDMWYHLTGLKRGDSLDSWIEKVAPEYMPMMLQTVADLLETRAVSNVDFMWKDGTWANFTTQCDFDEDGCFVGLIGTLTDATIRKKAELNEIANLKMVAEETERRSQELAEAHQKNQKLQQQRNMLASVAEISPTGLTIATRSGKLLWANRAFLSMYGLKESDKDEWANCTHEDDVDRLIETLDISMRTGTSFKSTHRLKNGKTVSTESILDQTLSIGGDPPYVSSIHDITLQVEGERTIQLLSDQRLAEAEQRRKDAITQKEQQALLIDMTCHETRNLIGPILQSSLLIKQSLTMFEGLMSLALRTNSLAHVHEASLKGLEEDLEACDAIIDSANQMERVANDVLGLAQIQLNQLDVTPVPFDLDARLKAIYRMFQADCKVKDLDLAIVLGDSLKVLGPKPLIKADPGRLQQIIVNLCSNAIKFTAKQPERKVHVRLEVDLRPPESGAPIIPSGAELPLKLADGQEIWLYVSVTDTGPGLKPDEISKLFSKFTQANPEIHTQMGGNGLGLFIAKQLCTLQDGRIEAVSPGKGSTFRFYIRAETVSKPAELSRSISAPQVQTIVSDLRALNVLVVDDNAINRKMLSRQLRMFKHSVQVAEDGLEALTLIELQERAGTPYDCIILDVNMPVMDGMQCTRRLREIEHNDHTRARYWIVGCTGNARPEQVNMAMQSGMNAVMIKPYRLPALLEAIMPPTIPKGFVPLPSA